MDSLTSKTLYRGLCSTIIKRFKNSHFVFNRHHLSCPLHSSCISIIHLLDFCLDVILTQTYANLQLLKVLYHWLVHNTNIIYTKQTTTFTRQIKGVKQLSCDYTCMWSTAAEGATGRRTRAEASNSNVGLVTWESQQDNMMVTWICILFQNSQRCRLGKVNFFFMRMTCSCEEIMELRSQGQATRLRWKAQISPSRRK